MDRIEVILYSKLNEQLEYCKISSVLSFATLNVSVLSKFLFVLIMINKGKVIIVLSRPLATLLGHTSIDISTKKLVGRNRTLQIKNNEELCKYTSVQMYFTISHTKLHTKL